MKTHSYFGIFCLHPNFASQSSFFTKNEIFSIKENCNYQEELTQASLLITDYSSIFFDFGYLKKPIIYIHFDYEEYRNNHFPNGYFDYKRDGFGPVCFNMQCLIKSISYELDNNCKLKRVYLNKIKRFFYFFDNNNSFRTFSEILNNNNNINENETINNNLLIIYVFILLISLKKIWVISF